MKCEQLGTDRSAKAWVSVDGQICEEFARPIRSRDTTTMVSTCYIPVESGQKIEIGCTFRGHAVRGHIDLLANGAFRNHHRFGLKHASKSSDGILFRHLQTERTFGEALAYVDDDLKTHTMRISDTRPASHHQIPSKEGHLIRCISVIISLQEPDDDRMHVHNYSQAPGNTSLDDESRSLLHIALIADPSAQAIPTHRKDSFRQHSSTNARSKGAKRYGSHAWAVMRFFYRDTKTIESMGVSRLEIPLYLAAPSYDWEAAVDRATSTRQGQTSNGRADVRKYPDHDMGRSSTSSILHDPMSYKGLDGKSFLYEQGFDPQNDQSGSREAENLDGESEGGDPSQYQAEVEASAEGPRRKVTAVELSGASQQVRECIQDSRRASKRESLELEHSTIAKQMKLEEYGSESMFDALEREEAELVEAVANDLAVLEAKETEAEMEMAIFDHIQRLQRHNDELREEHEQHVRTLRELDEAVEHARETTMAVSG